MLNFLLKRVWKGNGGLYFLSQEKSQEKTKAKREQEKEVTVKLTGFRFERRQVFLGFRKRRRRRTFCKLQVFEIEFVD